VRNAPWFAGGGTLVLAGVLVAADFPLAYLVVLTVGIVVSVALLWTRQMTGTDLRVADGQITWTSAGGSRTAALDADPVVAIGASSWRTTMISLLGNSGGPSRGATCARRIAAPHSHWPRLRSALFQNRFHFRKDKRGNHR